jgi:hypothetical protein
MSLRADLFSALSAAGTATASIVGSGAAARIYPVLEQAGAVAPYVIFQPIAATPATTHGEAAQVKHTLVQFSCYAATYDGAATLREALIADLDNVPLASGEKSILQDERDGYEPQVDLYRADADFLI